VRHPRWDRHSRLPVRRPSVGEARDGTEGRGDVELVLEFLDGRREVDDLGWDFDGRSNETTTTTRSVLHDARREGGTHSAFLSRLNRRHLTNGARSKLDGSKGIGSGSSAVPLLTFHTFSHASASLSTYTFSSGSLIWRT
jgi:hypothetical protein